MATTHPPTFSQWLRRLRTQSDLTQEALAELAFCSVQTIRSFETEKRRPSLEMAERLADVLGVAADQRAIFLRLARTTLVNEDAESATEPAPAPIPATLPSAATPFIGREAEINTLRQMLLQERCRFITVVGAGGMGKTRLALDVAALVGGALPDGVAFVALAALQHAQKLPFTLAEALGISLQGVMDVQQHLLTHLTTRTMLLVLDNFEHLLPDPAAINWLRALVQGAPGVQLLVTSRERLRLSGERIFELSGLALPTTTQPTDQADALMFFLDRAQHADSAFVLDNSNRAAIVRICRLLGGMPLGIELAAAWVRILSCEEIADEIARNIDFLELADRDASPRHRNMRAVFDHSWQLLNEAEQRLLAGLSYFQGGCTRPAAEQVAGATLPLLASLIDKSLVARDEGGRFVLHELVRQFATEHLQREPERLAAISRRHADYFGAFLRRNHPRLESTQQQVTMLEVSAETDNLLLAWEWLCANRRLDLVEPFVLAFGYYLDIRGHHQLTAMMMTQGLQAFQPVTVADLAIPTQHLVTLALLYGGRGFAVARLYRPAEARLDLQQALTLARQSKARLALYQTAVWAGFIFSTMGDFDQGIALLQEAIVHAGERQRAWEEGIAHMLLGLAYNLSGNAQLGYPAAFKGYHQLRAVGDPHAIAICVSQLSSLIEETGLGSDLYATINESLRLSSEQGDQWARALWLSNMGVAAHRQGDLAGAASQLQASIQLLEEMNELWGSTYTQVRLAAVFLAQNKRQEAEQLLHKVIEKANTAQMLHTKIDAQITLVELWLAQGKAIAAQQLLAHLQSERNLTPVQQRRVAELTARHFPPESSLSIAE